MSVPTALSALTVGGVPVGPSGDTFWHQGKVFYLDPESGVDANGRQGVGASIDRPMKTLLQAFTLCEDNSGDKVVLLNSGTTAKSVRLASTLTWSKSNVHLIGTGSSLHASQRSRITGESGGSTFTPLFTVSGNGCRFQNLQIFQDFGVDPIGINVTGDRNSWVNCHIAGGGLTAGAADAAMASVFISGGEENVFLECLIGLDTIVQEAANSEIELVSAANRTVFDRCFISANAGSSGAAHLWCKIDGSGDIDRYVWFRDCMFYNAVEAGATTMTNAMNVHNSAGGMVILQNCLMVGATDWAAADNANVFANSAVAASATAGFTIAVTRA